jgi:hypothetical protein
MPDDSRGARPGNPGPESQLILELVISGARPLSGRIGPAGTSDRIPFNGWIGLMSAIHALGGNDTTPPPGQHDRAPVGGKYPAGPSWPRHRH